MVSLKQAVPLSLEHQSILTSIWKPMCINENLQFSEYSFANVFLFRREHKYVFIPGDPPCVRGEFAPNQYYFIPTCLPDQLKLESLKCAEGGMVCLFPIPDKWLKIFHECHPTVTSCRGDSDYLFMKSKLQTLSGRVLSSRRNLLYQLQDKHDVESKPLTATEIPQALEILDAWLNHSKEPIEKTDYLQNKDALEFMERLNLFGRIVYADGEPIGFCIGELITPKTALMHFSKFLHNYKGVTPYIYQDFANKLPESVEWINLEQDLGIPSLRQAKESFAPDMLLTKWRLDLPIEDA